MNHEKTLGFNVFWAHRITGLLILGYLYLHLILLSAILSPLGSRHFNAVAAVVERPPFIFADIILFAIILFHGVNGVRLILADLGLLIQQNRFAIWTAMTVVAVMVFIASLVLFPDLLR